MKSLTARQGEVLGFLKTNLTDLANHYHALYQDETLEEERPVNFNEASNWYREFLNSLRVGRCLQVLDDLGLHAGILE